MSGPLEGPTGERSNGSGQKGSIDAKGSISNAPISKKLALSKGDRDARLSWVGLGDGSCA